MKHTIISLFALLLSLVASAQPEWQSLFDGKSFDGWTKMGGDATYEIKGGAIVGTTVPDTPNTFLCTEKEYGDFILELEFKVDRNLNSGVQFRSIFKDGLVRGYQYEIDPSERAWTGGVYDEKRRGWIYDLEGNPKAQKAFRQGKWNKLRIEARNDLIKTWINGVPAATVVDYMTPNGFIALQVHAVKNGERMQIAWRNIRIMDLGLNGAEGDNIDINLGEWLDKESGWLAQTWFDKETGRYKVNLSDEPWANKEPVTVLVADHDCKTFSNDEGWTGKMGKNTLELKSETMAFNGKRLYRKSPTLGKEAPEKAIVLFDGTSLDKWGGLAPKEWLKTSKDALESVVLTDAGNIEMTPGKGSIITKEYFGDCTLHMEFRLLGEKTNGGVYLQSRYELNIKDSWGQGKGQSTGALGNVTIPADNTPDFNYALPPMVWQTLDVEFTAPRFDENGSKTSNACLSAWVNGEQIYENIEIEKLKGAAGRLGEAEEGPVYLQEHGTAYQFRNIWIIKK